MSASILRIAARGPAQSFLRPVRILPRSPVLRTAAVAAPVLAVTSSFSTTARAQSEHTDETFEEFTARYEKEFDGVMDVFELQRNLNNAFAYDLVPSPSVVAAAMKAARRVNDFPTAVRIFEGIKAKVENQGQYKQYLEELKPLREEMGIMLKEEMFPDAPK